MTTKTATRIYFLYDGKKDRLVRASHPSPVAQHACKGLFTIRVATQEDLATLLPAGVAIEEIKHEQAELPTT